MFEIRSNNDGFTTLGQIDQSGDLQELTDHIQNIKNTTPQPLLKFQKGEPEALGVAQVFSGAFHIIFGVVFCMFVDDDYRFALFILSGLPFWSGVMYIISGSLSIRAALKPTLGLVRSNLVLNIISSVAAGSAIVLFVFAIGQHETGFISTCSYYKPSVNCEGNFNPQPVVQGIVVLLFILTLLQFCITISTSVFGCKAVCRTSYKEMTVIIYQNPEINIGDNTATADTTASTTEEF
ncbi:membrane-spanning 4-domains subfamily A member 4A-like [Pelobates fuscus]|uniref:membrane-spanning 4-domains subfamily A member 4A-like n=1 Tax=Pelobates fuscus TaxID=191477 RepID=UPI002FE45382